MKILWGGATAASQYEGGFEGKKGLDTQDCRPYLPRTSNATEETRLLTKEKIEEAVNEISGEVTEISENNEIKPENDNDEEEEISE